MVDKITNKCCERPVVTTVLKYLYLVSLKIRIFSYKHLLDVLVSNSKFSMHGCQISALSLQYSTAIENERQIRKSGIPPSFSIFKNRILL